MHVSKVSLVKGLGLGAWPKGTTALAGGPSRAEDDPQSLYPFGQPELHHDDDEPRWNDFREMVISSEDLWVGIGEILEGPSSRRCSDFT